MILVFPLSVLRIFFQLAVHSVKVPSVFAEGADP